LQKELLTICSITQVITYEVGSEFIAEFPGIIEDDYWIKLRARNYQMQFYKESTKPLVTL
jgi:hypothetical protein